MYGRGFIVEVKYNRGYILREKYMPGISEILSNDDFSRIVSDLCVDTIEDRDPKEYLEEYNGERRRRKTSVGFREPKSGCIFRYRV